MKVVSLGVADQRSAVPTHSCTFHEGSPEARRFRRDYIRAGLDDRREGLLVFGAPSVVAETRHELEEDLAQRLDDQISGGRLVLVESDPDPDICLDRLREALDALVERGYEIVRGLGRCTWGDEKFPPPEDQLWLEGRFNALIADRPVIYVCTYDAGVLRGAAFVYGLEAHDQVFLGGRLEPNRAFLEPSRYFAERLRDLPWLR